MQSFTFLLIILLVLVTSDGHSAVDSKEGVDEVIKDYPYIVALQYEEKPKDWLSGKEYNVCSGSLIAEEWVLTAAHCIDKYKPTQIRYGDMTELSNDTSTRSSRVRNCTIHPAFRNSFNRLHDKKIYRRIVNDLGLIFVDKVPLNFYGKLSAVEYTAMYGKPVQYAIFDVTVAVTLTFARENNVANQNEARRIQIFHAVVKKCEKMNKGDVVMPSDNGPFICLAAKCQRKYEKSLQGDSGGPVFHYKKIAGVAVGNLGDNVFRYTPVSPYLNWIHENLVADEKKR